jgi:hypothetical protein
VRGVGIRECDLKGGFRFLALLGDCGWEEEISDLKFEISNLAIHVPIENV